MDSCKQKLTWTGKKVKLRNHRKFALQHAPGQVHSLTNGSRVCGAAACVAFTHPEFSKILAHSRENAGHDRRGVTAGHRNARA
eukprot:1142380-Pelagomonas_calceolata.AAC.2